MFFKAVLITLVASASISGTFAKPLGWKSSENELERDEQGITNRGFGNVKLGEGQGNLMRRLSIPVRKVEATDFLAGLSPRSNTETGIYTK